MQMIRKNILVPTATLGIGVILFVTSLLTGGWYDWKPARFSVNLQEGIKQRSPTFQVDLTSNYLIEVEAERNMPIEKLNCLLGIASDELEYCRSIMSPIYLKWSVFSSGELVSSGVSDHEHDGAWSSTVSRTIGRFLGEKGKEYIVEVVPLRDTSELEPAKPRIIVRVHPFEYKGYYFFAQLLAWIALLITCIGFILLLIAIKREKIKNLS